MGRYIIICMILLFGSMSYAETVEQVTTVEQGDAYFKVSFMYQGHNLETISLPRSTTTDTVKQEIQSSVARWKEQRSDDNFNSVKKAFDGKTIEI